MDIAKNETDIRISERQAALLLGVAPKTLLNWRSKNRIIPEKCFHEKQYYNIKRVSYNKNTLLAWFNEYFHISQMPERLG